MRRATICANNIASPYNNRSPHLIPPICSDLIPSWPSISHIVSLLSDYTGSSAAPGGRGPPHRRVAGAPHCAASAYSTPLRGSRTGEAPERHATAAEHATSVRRWSATLLPPSTPRSARRPPPRKAATPSTHRRWRRRRAHGGLRRLARGGCPRRAHGGVCQLARGGCRRRVHGGFRARRSPAANDVLSAQGVVAGLLVQNALKYLLKFGQVSPYLGYNALKDYFPTMEMRPNPQCSNPACLERQKEYMRSKPARDAAAKAKMEAEASAAIEYPIHIDNEWNISVVDDSDTALSSILRTAADSLPEGLVRELPHEDSYVEPPKSARSGAIDDDLEELQRQLDVLNSS